MINLFSGTGRASASGFRAELVATLFASVTSLIAGVIGAVFLCALITYRMGDPLVSTVSLAIGLVGVARILLSGAYLSRRFGSAGASSPSFWEIGYAAGAWAFSSLVGLLGAVIVTRSSDVAMQAVFVTFALCYAAAAASRNAARPLIAYGQVFAMVPIACALMIDQQLFFRILSVLILLYLVAMVSVVNSLHGFLVQSHTNARDKIDLAEKLDAALDHMDRGLVILDHAGAARFWNQRFAAIFNLPQAAGDASVTARKVRLWILRSGLLRAANAEALVQMIATGDVEGPFDLPLRDGRIIEISMRHLSQGLICLVEDVTAARHEVARINRLARTDALTGLSNRMNFEEAGTIRLRRDLAVGHGALMCCLDLDGFKRINDTYGHPVGDRLLQLVADRLKGASGHDALVARLGGDEFVVLTRGQPFQSVAERIIAAFAYPFVADGIELSVGTSIGMAQAPSDGKTIAELMSNADLALYEAKSAGRNCWRVFQPAQRVRQDRMAQYEKKLRAAVEEAKIDIDCQMVLASDDGRITAFDFTPKWHDPDLGEIGHCDLSAACDSLGLSGALDEQIIAKACNASGRSQRNTLLVTSLSRQSLETAGLSFRLLSILQHSGVRAGRLVLAIDETVLSTADETALRNLADLRACGMRLALDGFGAGVGGLEAIKQFQPDFIRVSAKAACPGVDERKTAVMVAGLAAMAAVLGVPMIVEDVDANELWDNLPRQASFWAQGEALSPRVPATADHAFLRKSEARIAS
ncbi:diguanylate cyclase domain-containing protein [Bosea sp. RAC05]|uniref:diguanylate cyclase domain-containing protein n=1 Tax=Bosea sp. RAC05 TaxID=1842539 RepID=UPI000855C27D|nr:diguanylate cyclase [Bosea sp. RAC05]AOG02844.1 diguanylate cyclase domain protein [Bosea sp. RAC05]